jgi:hypothetical protein
MPGIFLAVSTAHARTTQICDCIPDRQVTGSLRAADGLFVKRERSVAAILAIEADKARGVLLTSIIREHAQVDVIVVNSVAAAIERLADDDIDVIVAPTLLSPRDSEQLAAHVKRHAGRHVQMLTIPALDLLREAPAEPRRGLGLFAWRRQVSLGLQFDPSIVGRQVADRVDRALTLRAEQRTAQDAAPFARPELAMMVRPLRKAAPLKAAHGEDRRVSHRTERQDVPWLWSVRLPWGMDVDVVNISTAGLLLESGSKVSPGVTLELRLTGPGLSRVVTARFVRSAVARVDRLGVRYHAGAQFEQPLDLPMAKRTAPGQAPSQSLAQLLSTVLADSTQPEAAPVRFARGLRELIRARDVHIRRTPIAPVDGTESIYFHVEGNSGSPTVLQIVFDYGSEPTAEEFMLMKASAGLAAAILELERARPSESQDTPKWAVGVA